ncbi:MAG: hypothetical protein WCI88_12975 [Chloroflexota bacterium]|jgi:hypothetical protein
MKIITNDKLVQRNALIGRYAGMAGLVVLAVGMYISFTQQETGVMYAWICLIIGFALAQFGIYFGNRWGRKPRPYEAITRELKGLDGNYALYHFKTPAAHLLVGPAGVWALFPFYQRGTIVYEKGRWKQKGGGFMLSYLKIFAQEGLGRVDLDVEAGLDSLKKYLSKKLPEDAVPEVQVAILFTNEQAVIEADDAPYPTIPVGKLKDLIKKSAKTNPLSLPKAKAVMDAIEMEG